MINLRTDYDALEKKTNLFTVVNPKTGRVMKVDGRSYKKLMRENKVEQTPLDLSPVEQDENITYAQLDKAFKGYRRSYQVNAPDTIDRF